MFELVFIDRETDKVVYAIADVAVVRYVTLSEVGFTDTDGRIRSASFTRSEKLVVDRRSTDDRRA